MSSLTRAFFFSVTLSAACASTVGGGSPDATPADASTDTALDAGSCALPNGGRCPYGASCPAGDGCNTCSCYGGRETATCTAIGCAVPDVVVPRDVATDAGSCALPNGGRCPVGATCPAGDGCNVCSCYPPGSALAACTLRGCIDAGPPGCRSDADCTGGRLCYFEAPGCDRTGVCTYPRDCANIIPYCGCDGETFRDCPGGTSGRPYRTAGECPVDAGAPGRCAGAHIGRGGQYCAAPDDGPLPLDCCQWNCDTRVGLCDSPPPPCPAGEVNTVSSSACWGPCVPPRACMPVACAADGTCPQGWRCNPADRRCVAG